jgi:acetyl-CoA C-acetyltransferase
MDARTPVLVGVGMVDQRYEDPTKADEALALMLRAARAAEDDAGAAGLLAKVGRVAMPRGQWHYADAGRAIAAAIGAPGAESVLALVGILQQSLIGDACAAIASGAIDVALVVGGEARYRNLRGRILGVETPETDAPGTPDVTHQFEDGNLVLESEVRGGLGGMPVGYYAIIESALRATGGVTVDAQRDKVAALYGRFSEIAAGNPHAWRREPVAADAIRDPSEKNPMLAFPYTKLHNSSWNVDQATALLLCSVGVAEAAGVDPSRWVFPLVSAESNHALALSQRPALAECPGVRIAGERAFSLAGVGAADVDLVELYSCFPVAVQSHARELGVSASMDWTVTGGMPFAGGPFNSYVLQSTGTMAQRLRHARPGAVGLVTSVSGLLTKHGVAVWSTAPGPGPFEWADVTGEVAASVTPVPVVPGADAAGPATVAGHTVIHNAGGRLGVALVDLANGSRAMVSTEDAGIVDSMEVDEWVARAVTVNHGTFTA